ARYAASSPRRGRDRAGSGGAGHDPARARLAAWLRLCRKRRWPRRAAPGAGRACFPDRARCQRRCRRAALQRRLFRLAQGSRAMGAHLQCRAGKTVSAAAIRHQAEMLGRRLEEDVAAFGLSVDRRLGPADATLGLTWMDEERTLLGARFHDAFSLQGAESLFLDAQLGWNVAAGWRLGAAFRQGW